MSEICPVCGGTAFDSFRMNLQRCAGCALVVDRTVWRPAANERLVEEWHGQTYDPQLSLWVRLFEAWNNRRTYRRISAVELHGRRMLEIGVGSGSFLQFMKKRGFDVTGCDLSKVLCKYVQDKYAIPMHCGYVAELDDRIAFDIVVMNHVLEHVADPVGFLRDIRRRIEPGGVLHVAVPNVAGWNACLPGWTSYEPYHLLYFTSETLRQTVERAGFVVIRQTTHESFSGWFLAILRTLLKTRQSSANLRNAARDARGSSLVEHAYRIAMICFGAITFPFRLIQGKIGKGDETVLIARIENDEPRTS